MGFSLEERRFSQCPEHPIPECTSMECSCLFPSGGLARRNDQEHPPFGQMQSCRGGQEETSPELFISRSHQIPSHFTSLKILFYPHPQCSVATWHRTNKKQQKNPTFQLTFYDFLKTICVILQHFPLIPLTELCSSAWNTAFVVTITRPHLVDVTAHYLFLIGSHCLSPVCVCCSRHCNSSPTAPAHQSSTE